MVDRDNMASVHMAMPFVITQNSQREWLGENDVLIAPAYSFMILTKAFAMLI
jgi:putative SOS response-associated peptidase YedK